jgi:hypothetical protein
MGIDEFSLDERYATAVARQLNCKFVRSPSEHDPSKIELPSHRASFGQLNAHCLYAAACKPLSSNGARMLVTSDRGSEAQH